MGKEDALEDNQIINTKRIGILVAEEQNPHRTRGRRLNPNLFVYCEQQKILVENKQGIEQTEGIHFHIDILIIKIILSFDFVNFFHIDQHLKIYLSFHNDLEWREILLFPHNGGNHGVRFAVGPSLTRGKRTPNKRSLLDVGLSSVPGNQVDIKMRT
ncbi:hypothetical protein ACJX0J_040015 [Zea mays]